MRVTDFTIRVVKLNCLVIKNNRIPTRLISFTRPNLEPIRHFRYFLSGIHLPPVSGVHLPPLSSSAGLLGESHSSAFVTKLSSSAGITFVCVIDSVTFGALPADTEAVPLTP